MMLRAIVLTVLALFGLLSQVETGSAAQTGIASFYWQGRLTANGERYNPNGISAAHKTLPFGTLVKVTMLNSGRSIVVRINDRGPFVRGRIIDLSRGAASKLGFISSGVTRVKIDVVGRRGPSGYVGNTRARRSVYARAKSRTQIARAGKTRGKVYASARQTRAIGGAKKVRRARTGTILDTVQY
jgi:rare lipoprotein A